MKVKKLARQDEIPCVSCDFSVKIENRPSHEDRNTADYFCPFPKTSCVIGKVRKAK